MSFKYNKTTTTTLKVGGILDTDRGIIDIDGDERNLFSLISDFNGADVEIVVKVKIDEELAAPNEE